MPETKKVKTLPELTEERNTLRNRLVYDLNVDSSQVLAKNILQGVVDAMNRNTKAFQEQARLQQAQNDKLTKDQKKYPTSAEFDVIAQHIEDFTKEASNSSVFERADKLRIMKYIETAIKKADIDEKEKKQLIEQYMYASKSIQNVTGIFDKASMLFTRGILNLTSFTMSIFSDLPPAFGWLLAKGSTWLADSIERKKTRQERTASLEYDIDSEKNRRVMDAIDQEESNDEQKEQKKDVPQKSSFAESKMERIQDTSGSLLDKAPTGSQNDPFFVTLTNAPAGKKDENGKPIIRALAGVLGGFASKLSGVLGVLAKPLTALGALITSLGSKLGLMKAADKAKDLLPDGKSGAPDAPDKGSSKAKRTNKPSVASKAAGAAKTALKLAAPIAVGAAALKAGNDIVNEKLKENDEKLKKHGYNPDDFKMDSDEDETDWALRRFRESSSKFEQSKNQENGLVNESKNAPRASVGTQVDTATKARINANEEKRAQEIQLNQANNTTVINNYNKTTNQNNARIVQVTNPQAQLVHGSR